MFTDKQLGLLIKEHPIDENLPFNSQEEESVLRFYKPLTKKIEIDRALNSRIEWNHYDSGYASFIDAWFYPSDGSSHIRPQEQHYMGIFVLLSRLSRYFVIGQGEKSWSQNTGSSYLPCFDGIDNVTHFALVEHINPITKILQKVGLQRLERNELAQPLPEKFEMPRTILSDPPFHHFDALFHWED